MNHRSAQPIESRNRREVRGRRTTNNNNNRVIENRMKEGDRVKKKLFIIQMLDPLFGIMLTPERPSWHKHPHILANKNTECITDLGTLPRCVVSSLRTSHIFANETARQQNVACSKKWSEVTLNYAVCNIFPKVELKSLIHTFRLILFTSLTFVTRKVARVF